MNKEEVKIKLPIDKNKKPDWKYMESYIEDTYKRFKLVLK